MGRTPTLWDCDVGQGTSVPGMIAALPIDRPGDVIVSEDGLVIYVCF